MRKRKTKRLRKFKALSELTEFFETHDMGEYWDRMPQGHFDIDIKEKTHVVALDKDLAEKLTTFSKAKQIPSGQLVNVWLREKLAQQ